MAASGKVTLRVKGGAELIRTLKRMGRDVKAAQEAALLAGAEIIRDQAARNVASNFTKHPTGTMMRGIRTATREEDL